MSRSLLFSGAWRSQPFAVPEMNISQSKPAVSELNELVQKIWGDSGGNVVQWETIVDPNNLQVVFRGRRFGSSGLQLELWGLVLLFVAISLTIPQLPLSEIHRDREDRSHQFRCPQSTSAMEKSCSKRCCDAGHSSYQMHEYHPHKKWALACWGVSLSRP